MSPKDAFGRDIGEDPVAEMGWESARSTATPGVETGMAPPHPLEGEPVGAEAATPPPPMLPSTFDVDMTPRRRRGGCLGAFIVVAVLSVLLVGGVIVAIVGEVADTIDGIDIETPSTPGFGGPQPEGLERESLLLRGNFAPAMRRLRAEAGGELRFVRVAPERITVQTVLADGRLRLANALPGGAVDVISTSPPVPGTDGIPWSRVDASAPRRMATAMTERAGRDPSAFGYAVLFAGSERWSAFLDDGTGFTARLDGRDLRRIGT
jgi:hypothetical protein